MSTNPPITEQWFEGEDEQRNKPQSDVQNWNGLK